MFVANRKTSSAHKTRTPTGIEAHHCSVCLTTDTYFARSKDLRTNVDLSCKLEDSLSADTTSETSCYFISSLCARKFSLCYKDLSVLRSSLCVLHCKEWRTSA